jgi:hypothetical protein
MTEHLSPDSNSNSTQLVNLNYLDREAELYKASKETLVLASEQVQSAVETYTKEEVKQVEDAIKLLNKKVEAIMETKYIKDRQQKIEEAQQQMMRSIKEASNTYFQVREVIRGKDNLSNEEKRQYEQKLFHKILDKFMSKEEKDLFTRIISAGPLLMLRSGGRGADASDDSTIPFSMGF